MAEAKEGARYVVTKRAQIDSAGRLAARIDERQVAYVVGHLAIQGPPGSIMKLYAGEPGPMTFTDGSQSGELDVADYAQPLYVEQYTPLVAVWTTAAGTAITGNAVLRVELQEVS